MAGSRGVHRSLAPFVAALLACATGCGSGSGTQVELDGTPQAITSVSCNDHTIDGRPRILLTLRSSEQIEVRADGVVWYRSKIEGTPSAAGGVQGFQVSRGADFDVTLAGHHLTGTVRCP